jgi:ABC-2 type transport system ATP-binding protein
VDRYASVEKDTGTDGAWAIETRGLTKRFGSFEAVRAIDLKVARRGITGFLGRNGAGKSTTIKMLLGMTHPTSGTGSVLGHRIDDLHGSLELRRRVAYVAEDKQTYAYMTVEELIRFTRSFYPNWRREVERELMDAYDLPPRRKVKALSKGMRTKLALLLALARRPELLILDEPSEGLDPVSIEELLERLAATAADGTAVFFSSHQIAEVERIADRVCIIDHGSIAGDFSLEHSPTGLREVFLQTVRHTLK